MGREVWDNLFEEIAAAIGKIMYGDAVCTDNILRNIVKAAMRAHRIDENLRVTIASAIKLAIEKEFVLLGSWADRATDAEVESFRCFLADEKDPRQIISKAVDFAVTELHAAKKRSEGTGKNATMFGM